MGFMGDFMGDVERFLVQFYPYRWPITIGALIVLAAAAAFAYRKGWHMVIWRRVILQHKLLVPIVATPVLALTIFAGWFTLSPLFDRSFLEEASPLAVAQGGIGGPEATPQDAAPGEGPDAVASGVMGIDDDASGETGVDDISGDDANSEFTPGITASGEFRGADDFHFGRGQALLIETAPGQYTLRFEDFSVRNGPGLFVYLSPDPDDYTDDSLELGELKATDGAFNYEVPAGTDVSQFKSAVVWCKPFGVLFAVAPLVELQP